MDQKEKEIYIKSLDVFMRLGFRSVSMDDLAKNLRISKKTLYKYVSDKNDLVYKCMDIAQEEDQCEVQEIITEGGNAIDEMFSIMLTIVEKLKMVHPAIFFDLEKYYPEGWMKFLEYKNEFVLECVLGNIEKGKKQGYYRKEINSTIISKLYLVSMDQVFNMSVFPSTEYKASEVYIENFRYHIRGISNQKGIDYLVEKVKREKLNI